MNFVCFADQSSTIEESNLENQTETFMLPGQKNYSTDYRFRVTVNDDTTSDEDDDIASEELVRVEPTSVTVIILIYRFFFICDFVLHYYILI